MASLPKPSSKKQNNNKIKIMKKKKKYTLSEIKALGLELLSSRSHINNLPLLLSFISHSSPPQFVLESLLSLQSFFTPLLPELPSSSSANSSKKRRREGEEQNDAELIYLTWLRAKFDELAEALLGIVVSPDAELALREVVLETIMEFVKVGNGGRFHSAIYHKLIHAIVECEVGVDALLDFLELKYFKYIDVRYFTYISLEKLVRNLEVKNISEKKIVDENRSHLSSSMELLVHNIHHILSRIPPLEALNEKSEYGMWNGSGVFIKEENHKKHADVLKAEDKKKKTKHNIDSVQSGANIAKKMKLKFTKAWIAFLSLSLPLDVYKEVLVTLHQSVIPHLSNPIMLCDFLTRSYDIGGVISVMALSSLYILMTQHGLEYPNFYQKLYVLLEPSVFMAKHRSKFFQLLDSCLKSPLLPAYLAAAFAKKLSRLSLSVPPSGSLLIIALVHNLLRRHPSINCLVHREDDNSTAEDDLAAKKVDDHAEDFSTSTDKSSKKLGIDHFNNEERDPVKTNAMRSSLWEIDTLRHHYCPPVSRFVLSLENDLTVRAKTTEVAIKDFSSGSYATIFGEEIRRRVKQVPLAFYKSTPTSLFSESDFPGWTFKIEDDSVNDNDKKVNNISKELDQNSTKRQRIECS